MYCCFCSRVNKKCWIRNGKNISYSPTPEAVMSSKKIDNYYTASFTIEFHKHKVNTTYRIAYSYPYTYSDLLVSMASLKGNINKSRFMKISEMCKSVGGRICPLITITDFLCNFDIKRRPVIILTSRVHPCETPASWVMQGIIEMLLDNNPLSDRLRKKFIFKLIPMLNPDGVALGMSR